MGFGFRLPYVRYWGTRRSLLFVRDLIWWSIMLLIHRLSNMSDCLGFAITLWEDWLVLNLWLSIQHSSWLVWAYKVRPIWYKYVTALARVSGVQDRMSIALNWHPGLYNHECHFVQLEIANIVVLRWVGLVASELTLPLAFPIIYSAFHILMLWWCIPDELHVS